MNSDAIFFAAVATAVVFVALWLRDRTRNRFPKFDWYWLRNEETCWFYVRDIEPNTKGMSGHVCFKAAQDGEPAFWHVEVISVLTEEHPPVSLTFETRVQSLAHGKRIVEKAAPIYREAYDFAEKVASVPEVLE